MLRPLFLLLILILSSQLLFAQGFNSTNGRNHPELNWNVAETEHFLIMFPDRISGIEDEAAAIAEESYQALSKNLEVEFNQKIRIYLSDEDEIVNGFAMPFSRPYTDIWVNLNDYTEIFTGQEKWLRKVVAHELAHIFHFEAVKSQMGLFQYLIGNPLPSFWTEGLAQYETEEWDSQRGDKWLRKAVFDDDLNFTSGQSLEDGRLRYAFGNAQLRFFAQQYGDTTLADLFQHREKLFGLFKYHDFGSAFEEMVDGGYSSFYDKWRKHVNVYYNTLAGQMERTDSLKAKELQFPGQFYFDADTNPNDSLIAVLSLTSISRPVTRLHVINLDSTKRSQMIGEGRIGDDLAWKSKTELLYSRLNRDKFSSLVNDVFLYDLKKNKETQITFGRKAKFPIAGPAQNQIIYVANEGGTGNLFSYDLGTKEEKRITNFEGNVQVLWPLWIENQNSWLIHRFNELGKHELVLIHANTKAETIIDKGGVDNRKAVVSPDGSKIAYISLRDDVPNIFIYDFESGIESRFTNLFTGGEIFGWLADYDSTGKEHLVIGASESRSRDHLYIVPADRKVFIPTMKIPNSYASWRMHAPPNKIEPRIVSNKELILNKYEYKSLKNLTHVTSFAFPYYSNKNDWGIFGTTNWTEPLGKHTITGGGWLSIPNPGKESYGGFSYINNQLFPTLALSLYKMPENGQFYGDEFLMEEYTGGDISANWPLDVFSAPYQSANFSAKLRYYSTDPFGGNRYTDNQNIVAPQKAKISDLQLGVQLNKQRPWVSNDFHPLDGTGVKISLNISEKLPGTDISSLTSDIHAYTILPAFGLNRIFMEGRFQAQWGDPLPQNYIGFSRYDNISIPLPNQVPFQFFGNNDRVRGFKEFVAGSRVAFGSLEYRMPFLPTLKTEILGLISFGGINLSVFTDAGSIWEGRSSSGETGTIYRWGAGAEIENKVSVFGLDIIHGVGYAQPMQKLLTNYDADIYYRIQTSIPF